MTTREQLIKRMRELAQHVDGADERMLIAAADMLEADGVPVAWQPIETAPKDSTSILIYCPDNKRKPVCEAWWAIAYEGDSGGHWQTPIGPNGRGYIILPSSVTHWMPLPPEPGTQPAIQERKRLTDEQIHKASLQAGMQEHYMGFHSGFIRFAKAVEAMHGIGADK